MVREGLLTAFRWRVTLKGPNLAVMQDVTIRALKSDDAERLAELHRFCFSDTFSGHLSMALLATYYRQFALDSAAIAYVAHKKEVGLVGWVVGAQKDKAFYNRFLRRRMLPLGGHLVVSFMRDGYVRRYLWARRHWIALAFRALFGRSPEPETDTSAVPSTRLIVIGLAPEQRGSGIAATLTEFFCAEAARRGDKTVGLSVKENNKAAVRFYEKDGWRLSQTRSGTALFERTVAGTT